MTQIIALTGKGGVGKSTISSQLIRLLAAHGLVLAVDADPNSNLSDKLGIDVPGTIGGLRNAIVADPDIVPAGVSKQDYMTAHVRQLLAETDKVDLLVMGRPEGEGCYCFTNDVLRGCFSELFPGYDYAVIDNEAGMEHMSRKTLPRADVLIFVSDPTLTGVRTAGRLSSLAREVGMSATRRILVINNVRGSLPDSLMNAAAENGLSDVFVIPHDENISIQAMRSEVVDLPEGSPFRDAVGALADSIRR